MSRCFCYFLFVTLLSFGVSAQPNAAFTFTNSCTGHPVQFTDHSTATSPDTITLRTWDFGDGGASAMINPTHTYSFYGIYSVSLIVKTVSGLRDTIIHTVESYAVPDVVVSASPFTGCQPLTVNFTNNTTIDTGSIASWLWDFDDGNTSTQQNPTHTFDILFGHTVKLTATSNKGCKDSTTRDIFVLQNPVCDYTASLVSLNDSSPIVNFTNLSSGGNIDLQWDFGDSTTSTEYSLIHTYDTCGTYNVILTATGTNTCVCVANYILEVCDTLVQIYNSTSDSYPHGMTLTIYPNPSNSETININYVLEKQEIVSFFVADVTGRILANPLNDIRKPAGKHTYELKKNFPEGVYFIIMNISGAIYSRKIIATEK